VIYYLSFFGLEYNIAMQRIFPDASFINALIEPFIKLDHDILPELGKMHGSQVSMLSVPLCQARHSKPCYFRYSYL